MLATGAAELRCYMNLMALEGCRSVPPRSHFRERLEMIQTARFDGVQFADYATPAELSECRARSLGLAASGRVNDCKDASALAERLAGDGYECATLHVGWGLEDDDEAARLIESILDASRRWRMPLFIETHRATIFQDMWRTVRFVEKFPELLINGDFSHWYTGQEMVYGGFEKKLAFIAPVLGRVRFLHGRIGNPGCMQVAIDPNPAKEPEYVAHFKQLWTTCFRNFCRSARAADRIYFVPELLAPEIYYARTFPNSAGVPMEESDRWQQAQILKQIATACFQEAAHS